MLTLKAILQKLNPLSSRKAAVEKLRDANSYVRLIFDSAPLGCTLWDKELIMIDCNQESIRLFDVADKSTLKDNFSNLSPEYQPCGRLSSEMSHEYIEKAFNEGSCRMQWIHLTADGNPIPCEIVLIRIEYNGEPIVAAYIRDLTEITATLSAMHKVENDLRLALDAAEDNAKAKDEFLDNMSHELRTPMNGILGFLRMAAQTDMTDIQKKYIADAEHSAKKLLKIINDVLDFNQIKDFKMKMNAVKFRLSEVFDEILGTYAPAARAKNLELNLRLSQDIPDLMVGDMEKVKRVLTSLIDNAIRFTEKGKITVRVQISYQDGDHIEILFYVRDTGIGITSDQMISLFNPFWQADTTITRKYGGTGFGLALSKHLAKLLGGKLWAESEYEEGSTFYFTARFSLSDNLTLLPQIHNDTEAPPEEHQVYDGAYDPANATILVVEDVEINQMVAEGLLTAMGFVVDIANNGQEALDMLDINNYSAILMDIQMPVLDGFAATEKIRQSEKYKNLPIIALSAHAMSEDREKSLAHGMNDHITKPIDPDELGATLKKWLISA